ncbi:MAG: DUF554 domain-containing protein [Spirochaetales bacterium]|nr:DUF554 domain-containing protein [Candidatus Physcosoma equi]
MIGLGTLINTVLIILGGAVGLLFGKHMNQRLQETLNMANGVSVLFIGISGAMTGMLQAASNGSLSSISSMLVVLSLAFGAVVGELINIEGAFERFGEWLKIKTGNAKDKDFVNGFVTASLTVCIGAMAIVGSIQDGILGDYTTLAIKGILDFIIIMVMTCSMGKGCIFSAIPVFALEGGMTLLSKLIEPIMTDAALFNLSTVGSNLIFCVGLNLVWGKRVRVANLLPSIVFAVIIAFLPIAL